LEEAGFVGSEVNEKGHRSVAAPGSAQPDPPPVVAASGSKKRKTLGGEAPPVANKAAKQSPPFDAKRLAQIKAFIKAEGGVVEMNRISREIKDTKWSELESLGFVASERNEFGQKNVALPGSRRPQPPAARHTVKGSKDADEEVAELDEGVLAAVIGFVEEAGGVMSLGKIASKFRGVKCAQLELAGFAASERNASGEKNVALPGNLQPEPPEDTKQKVGTKQKGGKPKDSDEDVLAKVTRLLEQGGGVQPMSKIAEKFEGVSWSTLEMNGFVASASNKFGQKNVALPGSDAPEPPDANFKGHSGKTRAGKGGKGTGKGKGKGGKGKAKVGKSAPKGGGKHFHGKGYMDGYDPSVLMMAQALTNSMYGW